MQCLILLYFDLRCPATLPSNIKEAIEAVNLPDLTNVKVPVLQKKKVEKEQLLNDLSSLDISVNEITTSAVDLLNYILLPAFHTAIECHYFEKVHWSACLKKCAGIFLYLMF